MCAANDVVMCKTSGGQQATIQSTGQAHGLPRNSVGTVAPPRSSRTAAAAGALARVSLASMAHHHSLRRVLLSYTTRRICRCFELELMVVLRGIRSRLQQPAPPE